jgi:uncharacterized membrane-anchored protein YhcB (DUF1043 family)
MKRNALSKAGETKMIEKILGIAMLTISIFVGCVIIYLMHIQIKNFEKMKENIKEIDKVIDDIKEMEKLK